MNNYYIYSHINPLKNEIFYIGMGRNKRAYQISGRSKFWTNYYKKYGREVDMIDINLSLEEAREKEIFWIKKIGRKDKNNGTLVNMSDGGEDIWNRGKSGEGITRYGMKNSEYQKNIVSNYMKKNNPMNNQISKIKSIESNKLTWINKTRKPHPQIKNIEVYKDDVFIGEYFGIKEVSEKLNLVYSSIQKCLYGKRNSLFGYKIKYIK